MVNQSGSTPVTETQQVSKYALTTLVYAVDIRASTLWEACGCAPAAFVCLPPLAFWCLDMICAPSLGLQGSPRPPEEERAEEIHVRLWHLTVFSARWLRVSRTFSGVSAVKNYFHFTVVQWRVTQKSSGSISDVKSRRVWVRMRARCWLVCVS